MRKGTAEMHDGPTDRERRARQLRLVLQCAGPGSVTGSRTSQCRREGRPHGGFKGLSNKYPLSRSGFDKQEFMEEVKNSVNAQYREEQKCHTNSPNWLPAANKEKNHTGEQPLILQSFLAANKQEQVDGVLPASNPVNKRQSQSAGMYRDEPDHYCRGNSTHQYLTATEMPGQSEKLVDLALGRPTRTSLLRVRQRTKSAPGVRAIVEIKTHLHKQQQLAAKTEDRYKSVDVPQDLLPVTEGDETVHQFLIGARYNRMYHHDAKCLRKLGLFVSRQDPLHCFKMSVPAKDNKPSDLAHLKGIVSSLNQTASCESFGRESNLSELAATNLDPQCPKSAWSTAGQDDLVRQSTTPIPSPSPADCSQKTFLSKRGSGWRKRPKMKIIDGNSLKQDGGHECCVMCKSEEFPRHYQRFTPGNHFMRVKDAEEEGHHKDHMLVQQYHLRIMGIKYGVTSGSQAPPPPRSNLLYTTKKSGNLTELPFIKRARNVRTNNRNNGSDYSSNNKPQDVIADRLSSNSSKISVRISTPEGNDAPQGESTNDNNNDQKEKAVTNEETEISKKDTGMLRSNKTSEENAPALTDDPQDGGDDKDASQGGPSGAVSANNAEEDDERNGEDITEAGMSMDHPADETQDTTWNAFEDNARKENSDLEDIHSDHPAHDGREKLEDSGEIVNPTDPNKDCETTSKGTIS